MDRWNVTGKRKINNDFHRVEEDFEARSYKHAYQQFKDMYPDYLVESCVNLDKIPGDPPPLYELQPAKKQKAQAKKRWWEK